MICLRIYKKYENKYCWYVQHDLGKITEKELYEYELSVPIYRKKRILMGVKNIEWGWINEGISILLDTLIMCKDCVLIFDKEQGWNETSAKIMCNIIKEDLIKLGVRKERFNY